MIPHLKEHGWAVVSGGEVLLRRQTHAGAWSFAVTIKKAMVVTDAVAQRMLMR